MNFLITIIDIRRKRKLKPKQKLCFIDKLEIRIELNSFRKISIILFYLLLLINYFIYCRICKVCDRL